MENKYTPELGQAVFGAPWSEHELPPIAELAFMGALDVLSTAAWNHLQRTVDFRNEEDMVKVNEIMPNLEVHAYFWGEDEEREKLPNFKFRDVEIRWYKYPGRGMSTNIETSPAAWSEWFTYLEKYLREVQHSMMPGYGHNTTS